MSLPSATRPATARYSARHPDSDLLGDYSGDGTVDAADYTVWRDALGTTVARYFVPTATATEP